MPQNTVPTPMTKPTGTVPSTGNGHAPGSPVKGFAGALIPAKIK